MNKDYEAVDKYYYLNQNTEFRMCHFLNKHRPLFLVDLGYCFEMEANSQYNRNDIVLVQYPIDRIERNEIIKIEYEYGRNQIEWDFELPRIKWQGLNLVTRKKYGETFKLFIKSSPTYRSFFAIDCSNEFIQKNFGNNPETLQHNLDFETNNEFYRIYWDDVTKHQFIDDKNNGKLENGNICLVEDDNWSIFYRFLYRRFLKK